MNVDPPHVTDLIPAYVLGCLDANEVEAVETHLTDCPVCQREVALYQGVVDELPLGVPLRTPPPTLKARLLARVQQDAPNPAPVSWQQRMGAIWRSARLHPIWRPALVVALILVGLGQVWLWQRAAESSPWQTIVLSPTEYAPEAQGVIVVQVDGRLAALITDDLPSLPPEQQYQLWLIADGQRTSGAVFSVSSSGQQTVSFEAPRPVAEYQAFGITIEPAGGSPGPTGPRVLGHGL